MTKVTRRVLIVDDDEDMRRLLSRLLEGEGYDVSEAADSGQAFSAFALRDPDIVLLDIVLGDEDGGELLKELRRLSDVPVVCVTGRGHEMDRIAGLKLGADDYLVKPFSPGELAARLESVLRRSRPRQPAAGQLRFGPLAIDPRTREVEIWDQVVELTAKEFDLLAFLAASPRQVFSRGQLLDHVWASSSDWQDDATVTEHVRRVRRKIETDPDRPEWITTIRGVGYRFEPDGGGRGRRSFSSGPAADADSSKLVDAKRG
jgi:two-component system, OmpR family, phosphate regulon response regulator PhoB